MRRRLLLTALLLICASPAGASPITVNAGDVVSLSFGTVPGNWDPADPPDYLQLTIGNIAWLGAEQTATWALYDGDRLLASRTGGGQGLSMIGAGQELPRDWTPLWQWPMMDFSSLLDGSIAGRFEVTPTAGAFTFDPATLATCTYCPTYIGPHPVMLWDVTPNGGFWAAQGDFDWVRDVQIGVRQAETLTPVPEPGTLSLLATGLGVGFARLRKERRRRREDAPRAAGTTNGVRPSIINAPVPVVVPGGA